MYRKKDGTESPDATSEPKELVARNDSEEGP